MNVLHYSFSLSACPKCHLLICKHTSLAELDFNTDQQENNTTISIENNLQNPHQQQLSDGINLYIFPSTTFDNRYSWTTFGTEFDESSSTIGNLSSNNETICENIPFANENILNSSLFLTPTLNQLVRTQSERFNQPQQPISLPRNLSLSTIYNKSSSSSENQSYPSFFILLLILTFLITNTIDIVLIYIYYHTNYIYLISFLSTILLCEMILWINSLIQSNKIPSYLLLIPFSRRFYYLYKLLELLIILFEKNQNRQLFDLVYKMKEQKLYRQLTLFYLIHTGFFTFVNLYFWSNKFQISTRFFLNMDSFIPQWVINTHSLLPLWQISTPVPSTSAFVLTSIAYYLFINYSLLSTFLTIKQYPWIVIFSKICLIIPRIYTFIFLFHLNAYWLSITFLLVHFILMLTLIFDRLKFKQKQNTVFLQIIFSFITHQSIDDISINALILLENISVFLHRLYLEIFSFYHHQTTLRLIIFISILISLQIIGFIFHILSKYLLYRTKTITKL